MLVSQTTEVAPGVRATEYYKDSETSPEAPPERPESGVLTLPTLFKNVQTLQECLKHKFVSKRLIRDLPPILLLPLPPLSSSFPCYKPPRGYISIILRTRVVTSLYLMNYLTIC